MRARCLRPIAAALVSAALAVSGPAAAQVPADTADGPRALELTYRLDFTRAWGLGPAEGATSSTWAAIPRTRGFGVSLSYAPRARIALFLATDLTTYGDLSGFSTVVVGGSYRTPVAPGLALSATAGLGHVVYSGDEGFWNVVWGGDVRASLSRRFTLCAAVETFEPLGDARGGGRSRSSVTGAPSRLVLGVGWSFGRRVR